MSDELFGEHVFVGHLTPTARVLGPDERVTDRSLRPRIRFDVLEHLGPLVLEHWGGPVTRSEVTVPISTSGAFVDTVLYEDPRDPAQSYWLPRYRLRRTADDRYEIGYELVDGLWLVRFGLERYPAPEVEAAAAAAAVLPHELTMVVTSGASVLRTYPVAEIAEDERGWRLVLRLTLEERDALLRAFTSDDERASIEVRRQITAAAPVLRTPPADDGPMVGPLLSEGRAVSVLLPVVDLDRVFRPALVPVLHVEPPPPVPPRPDEPQVLSTDVGPAVDLLRVARPLEEVRRTTLQDAPGLIAVHARARSSGAGGALDARRGRRVFDPLGDLVLDGVPPVEPLPSPQPTTPPEALFTTTTTTVASAVPLRFDVATHPYLFPVGRPAPVAAEYELVLLPWEGDGPAGRSHVYCQDLSSPDLFRYLPDAFLVGTLSQPPHGPELLLSVGRSDADLTQPVGIMSCHLVPQTSSRRLADARDRLASRVPLRPGVPARPRLEPMLASAEGLLQLPGGAHVRSNDLDLVNGWWVSASFPYADLQEAYAVLSTSGTVSALLRGDVTVAIGEQRVQVPVEVRLDRPAVPALTWTSTPAAPDEPFTVTLRNVGPDPVVVPPPPAWLRSGDELVPLAVTAPESAVTLAPGAELPLTVSAAGTPAPPPGVVEEGRVLLDLTAVRVEMTPEAAVQRTLDRRVARLPRTVRVLTTPATLSARGVSTVALEFEDAAPVTVDASAPAADVLVPVPLGDILLGRSAGSYRFRQTLFLASGDQVADEAWRSSDRGLLGVPVP